MGQPLCPVRYSGIDDAIDMINRIGKRGNLAKTDIKSAFRLLRVSPSDFDQLSFSFDKKFYFDKCLPFGTSISCSLLEKNSTALHWFTEQKTGNKDILHYLDDFLFGAEADSPKCQFTLQTFKSDGETLSNRNALLMSVFAKFPLLPILLIMSMASSMPEYLTVQNSGSMKSLTEYWVGYERLWISRKSSFFFLTRTIGDTLKVGIGG
jgi:hypothetical protein